MFETIWRKYGNRITIIVNNFFTENYSRFSLPQMLKLIGAIFNDLFCINENFEYRSLAVQILNILGAIVSRKHSRYFISSRKYQLSMRKSERISKLLSCSVRIKSFQQDFWEVWLVCSPIRSMFWETPNSSSPSQSWGQGAGCAAIYNIQNESGKHEPDFNLRCLGV